jgi:hypothetical protein
MVFKLTGSPLPRACDQLKVASPSGKCYIVIGRAHPLLANLPDICLILKMLSTEYQPYSCVKIDFNPICHLWADSRSSVRLDAMNRFQFNTKRQNSLRMHTQ